MITKTHVPKIRTSEQNQSINILKQKLMKLKAKDTNSTIELP